jgi:hypothetical protein
MAIIIVDEAYYPSVRNTVGDAKFISIMTAGFVCPVEWY